jgi:hypothetical protein
MERKAITNFEEVGLHLDQLDLYVGSINMRVRTIEELISGENVARIVKAIEKMERVVYGDDSMDSESIRASVSKLRNMMWLLVGLNIITLLVALTALLLP